MDKDRINLLKSNGYDLEMFEDAEVRRVSTVAEKEQWTLKFNKLKQYKDRYGDCLVPVRHNVLGEWVRRQRKDYRCLQEGKQSHITPEQVQLLEGIAFIWDGASYQREKKQAQWLAKFNELNEYKEEYGNFLQLREHKPQLRNWIRDHINRLSKSGRTSAMDKDRINLLKSKGYDLGMFDEAEVPSTQISILRDKKRKATKKEAELKKRKKNNGVIVDVQPSADANNEAGSPLIDEIWAIERVYTAREITSKKIKCQSPGCDLTACSVWKNGGDEKWSCCLDCKERDFGGWLMSEVVEMMGDQAHMNIIQSHCSRKSSNSNR